MSWLEELWKIYSGQDVGDATPAAAPDEAAVEPAGPTWAEWEHAQQGWQSQYGRADAPVKEEDAAPAEGWHDAAWERAAQSWQSQYGRPSSDADAGDTREGESEGSRWRNWAAESAAWFEEFQKRFDEAQGSGGAGERRSRGAEEQGSALSLPSADFAVPQVGQGPAQPLRPTAEPMTQVRDEATGGQRAPTWAEERVLRPLGDQLGQPLIKALGAERKIGEDIVGAAQKGAVGGVLQNVVTAPHRGLREVALPLAGDYLRVLGEPSKWAEREVMGSYLEIANDVAKGATRPVVDAAGQVTGQEPVGQVPGRERILQALAQLPDAQRREAIDHLKDIAYSPEENQLQALQDVASGMSWQEAVEKNSAAWQEFIGQAVIDPLNFVPAKYAKAVFAPINKPFELGAAALGQGSSALLKKIPWVRQAELGKQATLFADRAADALGELFGSKAPNEDFVARWGRALAGDVDASVSAKTQETLKEVVPLFMNEFKSSTQSNDVGDLMARVWKRYKPGGDGRLYDDVPADQVAETLRQAVVNAYRKGIGLEPVDTAPGLISRALNWQGALLKEQWLSVPLFNTAYLLTNTPSDFLRAVVTGHWLNPLDFGAADKVNTLLKGYGMSVPRVLDRTLFGELTGVQAKRTLGGTEKVPVPLIGRPSEVANRVDELLGTRLQRFSVFNELETGSKALTAARNLNLGSAINAWGRFTNNLERNARLTMFYNELAPKLPELRERVAKTILDDASVPEALRNEVAGKLRGYQVKTPQDLLNLLGDVGKAQPRIWDYAPQQAIPEEATAFFGDLGKRLKSMRNPTAETVRETFDGARHRAQVMVDEAKAAVEQMARDQETHATASALAASAGKDPNILTRLNEKLAERRQAYGSVSDGYLRRLEAVHPAGNKQWLRKAFLKDFEKEARQPLRPLVNAGENAEVAAAGAASGPAAQLSDIPKDVTNLSEWPKGIQAAYQTYLADRLTKRGLRVPDPTDIAAVRETIADIQSRAAAEFANLTRGKFPTTKDRVGRRTALEVAQGLLDADRNLHLLTDGRVHLDTSKWLTPAGRAWEDAKPQARINALLEAGMRASEAQSFVFGKRDLAEVPPALRAKLDDYLTHGKPAKGPKTAAEMARIERENAASQADWDALLRGEPLPSQTSGLGRTASAWSVGSGQKTNTPEAYAQWTDAMLARLQATLDEWQEQALGKLQAATPLPDLEKTLWDLKARGASADELTRVREDYWKAAKAQGMTAAKPQMRATLPKEAVDRWAQAFANELRGAVDHATFETNKLLFDYGTKGGIEKVLHALTPFYKYQTSIVPWAIRAGQERPWLPALAGKYEQASERDVAQQNLPARYKGSMPLPKTVTRPAAQVWNATAGQLFGQTPEDARYRANPKSLLAAVFGANVETPESYLTAQGNQVLDAQGNVVQTFNSPEAAARYVQNQEKGFTDETPGLARTLREIVDAGGALGMRPWPYMQALFYKMGVYGDQYPGDILPYTTAVRAATGARGQPVDLEKGLKDWETDGKPNQVIKFYTVIDLAKQVQAKRLSPQDAMRAVADPTSPTYRQAEARVQNAQDVRSMIRKVVPMTVRPVDEGEQQLRATQAAQGQVFDQLSQARSANDLGAIQAGKAAVSETYRQNPELSVYQLRGKTPDQAAVRADTDARNAEMERIDREFQQRLEAKKRGAPLGQSVDLDQEYAWREAQYEQARARFPKASFASTATKAPAELQAEADEDALRVVAQLEPKWGDGSQWHGDWEQFQTAHERWAADPNAVLDEYFRGNASTERPGAQLTPDQVKAYKQDNDTLDQALEAAYSQWNSKRIEAGQAAERGYEPEQSKEREIARKQIEAKFGERPSEKELLDLVRTEYGSKFDDAELRARLQARGMLTATQREQGRRGAEENAIAGVWDGLNKVPEGKSKSFATAVQAEIERQGIKKDLLETFYNTGGKGLKPNDLEALSKAVGTVIAQNRWKEKTVADLQGELAASRAWDAYNAMPSKTVAERQARQAYWDSNLKKLYGAPDSDKARAWRTYYDVLPPGRAADDLKKDPRVAAFLDADFRETWDEATYAYVNQVMLKWALDHRDELGDPRYYQSARDAMDTFREKQPPDIYDVQDGYYDLPANQQRAYKAAHPELQKYWDDLHAWQKDPANQVALWFYYPDVYAKQYGEAKPVADWNGGSKPVASRQSTVNSGQGQAQPQRGGGGGGGGGGRSSGYAPRAPAPSAGDVQGLLADVDAELKEWILSYLREPATWRGWHLADPRKRRLVEWLARNGDLAKQIEALLARERAPYVGVRSVPRAKSYA